MLFESGTTYGICWLYVCTDDEEIDDVVIGAGLTEAAITCVEDVDWFAELLN